MDRETLHHLIDRVPDNEIPTAHRFLQFLASSPAYRAALSAPIDDEPVTEEDVESIAKTADDIQAGRVVPHEEILREFGLQL